MRLVRLRGIDTANRKPNDKYDDDDHIRYGSNLQQSIWSGLVHDKNLPYLIDPANELR